MSDKVTEQSKPALVWVKAANPLTGTNGSAFVSMAFARVFATRFDLHLVCFRAEGSDESAARTHAEPFTSITLVTPDHQKSQLHRVVLGSYFKLLDLCGIRPLAESIESCASMRITVAERIEKSNAKVLVAEYWTMGSLLSKTSVENAVLVLHDVEHENVKEAASGGNRALEIRSIIRSRLIRHRELHAARHSEEVVFLSNEDRDDFIASGVVGGKFVPVPVQPTGLWQQSPSGSSRVLFLGSLHWHPNRDGLRWFLNDIWPTVRQLVPAAELIVVGGGEPEDTESDLGVSHLGWVESLDAQLRLATVGIVPIRTGTGAKIKTIEMMSSGLPIVTTTRGARGTAALHGGAVVADEASEFATEVASLLQSEDDRIDMSKRSIRAVEQFHSTRRAEAVRDALFDRVMEPAGGD